MKTLSSKDCCKSFKKAELTSVLKNLTRFWTRSLVPSSTRDTTTSKISKMPTSLVLKRQLSRRSLQLSLTTSSGTLRHQLGQAIWLEPTDTTHSEVENSPTSSRCATKRNTWIHKRTETIEMLQSPTLEDIEGFSLQKLLKYSIVFKHLNRIYPIIYFYLIYFIILFSKSNSP